MRDSPGSVVTLLCSGIQLYSAERRIADCILNDEKWASVVTSAQLARASQSSEATVTRLCKKDGLLHVTVGYIPTQSADDSILNAASDTPT